MTRKERFAAKVAERNKRVLAAAVALARKRGFASLTRDAVATQAGVAQGCVNAAYGTVAALRDEVMRCAVDDQMLDIVAQGLAVGHDVARNASPDLKARALATLT